MTGHNELLVSPGIPSDKWGLFPHMTGHSLMIGWRLAGGRSVDDGVPPAVANVLAHALIELGWVSFFEGSQPNQTPDDRVSPISLPGLAGQVRAAAIGLPKEVYLVSTRRPELVAAAFEASFFSWVMQGQAILISPHDRKPPKLEWSQMMSITGGETSALEAALSVWGATAVVRPGVDGDVAGLLATDEIAKERAMAGLRHAASSRGFELRVLTESEFSDALAE